MFGLLAVRLGAFPFGPFAVAAVDQDIDECRRRLRQPLVVGLQGAQHRADVPVVVAMLFEQGDDIAFAFRHEHRHDDVAEAFAGGLAHHPPHRLHDVDLALLRVEEGNRVEGRHIHAFGEHLHVADHPCLVSVRGVVEPAAFLVALERRAVAVQMAGLKVGALAAAFERPRDAPLKGDVVVDGVREPPGAGDGGSERDAAGQCARPALAFNGAVQGQHGAEQPAKIGFRRLLGHVSTAQRRTDAGRQLAFADAEHDHAVVGKLAGGDGFREPDLVQQRAVNIDVRHVHHFVGQPPLFRSPLRGPHGLLRVDALGGGHVEAFGGAQPGVVVERLEIHPVLADKAVPDDAGGAVGFVGDGEVEGRRILERLRFAHLVQRVVGAKDRMHRVGWPAHAMGDFRRIRNHIAHQRIGADFVAFAAAPGGAVGADHYRRHWPRAVRQPFAAGLRHQGDGGRSEQHQPQVRHQAFGQAQRGERFARAAGHHQLAAGVPLPGKAVVNRVDGLLLQWLWVPLLLRPLEFQDFVVEKVQKVDAGDPGGQADDGPLGGRVPSAGGDDPAQPERRPCGMAQKAVDVRLGDHRVFRIALALDGDDGAVGLLRH